MHNHEAERDETFLNQMSKEKEVQMKLLSSKPNIHKKKRQAGYFVTDDDSSTVSGHWELKIHRLNSNYLPKIS